MTADQIIAFNAGRRLLKRGYAGYRTSVVDLDSHARHLRPRELMTAARMGETQFELWARQGALHEFTRLIKSAAGA